MGSFLYPAVCFIGLLFIFYVPQIITTLGGDLRGFYCCNIIHGFLVHVCCAKIGLQMPHSAHESSVLACRSLAF